MILNKMKEVKQAINKLSQAASRTLDYEIGWMSAETLNKPTTYKGRGRPRKTDYVIQKHPFDGKIKKFLNTWSHNTQ